MSRVDGFRHAVFVAAFGLVMGLAKTGRGEVGASPLALTWEAPAGCPTVDKVAGEVERTLAKSGTPPAPFTAAAYVMAGPGQTWEGRLVLNVRGVETERRFVAESCQALASATALIIAVALDGASGEPAAPAPVSPVPEVAARSTVPPAASAPYSLGVNGVVDFDTLPSPPAAGLEVVVRRKAAVGPVHPAWMVGATVLRNSQPAVNSVLGPLAGDFWLFSLSGRVCLGVAVAAKLEIAPCIGTEVVAMHATNDGWASVGLQTETRYWFSLLGSFAVSYQAAPSLELVLRADGVMPTAQRTFDIAGNVLPAYVVPGAALRGALGVAWLFQ